VVLVCQPHNGPTLRDTFVIYMGTGMRMDARRIRELELGLLLLLLLLLMFLAKNTAGGSGNRPNGLAEGILGTT
jgi:hypothetical protein